MPPRERPVSIAPSLIKPKKGVGTEGTSGEAMSNGATRTFESQADVTDGQTPFGPAYFAVPYATDFEPSNPTVVPQKLLEQFHWTFLIRHPRNSINSYYRCCLPPLSDLTGFHNFRPDEAGYDELRRLFDYLIQIGFVGPDIHGRSSLPENAPPAAPGTTGTTVNGRRYPDICVIDADDLLDNPEGIIQAFCANVGIEYSPSMLVWDDEESHAYARKEFEKWRGFHEDAIASKDLKPRAHKKHKTDEQLFQEWTDKYGEEGARTIRKSVRENVGDYEYLKQFAIQV